MLIFVLIANFALTLYILESVLECDTGTTLKIVLIHGSFMTAEVAQIVSVAQTYVTKVTVSGMFNILKKSISKN